MACSKEWDFEFVASNTDDSFHNKEYRVHRAKLLQERERSLLPATQSIVMTEKRKDKLQEQINVIHLENRRLLNIIDENKMRMRLLSNSIRGDIVQNEEKTAKPRYIAHCPVSDCNGFVEEGWKCGICEVHVCKKCHHPKASKKDANHECNKEDVETAKLLAKDTKPCPNCKIPIFKIGGCFSAQTPILMWDGSIKRADEIDSGDKLIGDDGFVRTVLELTSGQDQMYTVKQKRGADYTVNSQHILTVAPTGHLTVSSFGSIYKVKWFDPDTKRMKTKNFEQKSEADVFRDSLPPNVLFDITISDFLSLPKSTQESLKGIKSSGVNWVYRDVKIDPYLLGMWLGDGYSNGKEFASNDHELISYWKSWAKNNDAIVNKTTNKYRYYVRRNPDSNIRSNPLKEQLQYYNLVQNKHIPNDFLINSRDIRLKLLAGLIDTDGCVQNKGRRIEIIQCNPNLSKQIQFLSRSLGFSVSITTRTRKDVVCPNTESKDYKDQQHINISGKLLDEIPTLLPRKKCVRQVGGVDLLRTGIEVVSQNTGNYYGWRVDGNKRFLLGDFTIGHNCDQMWCVTCKTPFSWNTGKIETGIIHNPHFYQFQRNANNGVAPRAPGDVRCGGTPDMRNIQAHFKKHNFQIPEWLSNARRMVDHVRYVELRAYPNTQDVQTHQDLRVRFLMKKIDEKKWLSTLQQREKKREKNRAINMVLTMFADTLGNLFENLCEVNTVADILAILQSMYELKKYVNKHLEKIGKRFKNKTPIFENNWECKSVGRSRRR